MKTEELVIDDDEFATIAEICKKNGFAYEEYKVTTKDGYILTLNRIPGSHQE